MRYKVSLYTVYLKILPVSKSIQIYPGSMPGGGARGQNLVHLQKLGFLC